MKKRLPKFRSDSEVEEFLDNDLSEYLVGEHLRPMTFEFQTKEKIVNLRISAGLLEEVKKEAKKRQMPYQRYIRQVLELSLKA